MPPQWRAKETSYKGVQFRSRIEARWATVLDGLGVVWQYERQGFVLGTLSYLPDLYLPQIGASGVWLEIKGEKPSDQELEKADLLALYTRKPVYVQWGDIELPVESQTESAIVYWPSRIYHYEPRKFKMTRMPMDVEPSIASVLTRLQQQDLYVYVRDHRLYTKDPYSHCTDMWTALIDKYRAELTATLQQMPEGRKWRVEGGWDTNQWWCECPKCGLIGLAWRGRVDKLLCRCVKTVAQSYLTPKIVKAFEDGRSARFEFPSPIPIVATSAAS